MLSPPPSWPLMLAALVCGLGVAVAVSGAFVWFYNRVFSRMREVWFKKFLSLALLPLGCLLGLLAAGRLAVGGPGGIEQTLWWLAGVTGWMLGVRYARVAREKHEHARGSRFERCRHLHIQAIDWEYLPRWAAPLLRLVGPLNGVSRLRIHRRRIVLPDLDPAFDGYRIVHLTDFHIHPTLRMEWYDAVVDEAMRHEPDLILYGGDFISKPPFVPRIPRVMERLAAPDGVYYVRGNHDFWKGGSRVARQARAAGLRLLSNEGVVLKRGEAALSLLGFETPYVPLTAGEKQRLRALPAPRLGLVHTPDAFAEAAAAGCFLALAGHSHGGQVRLPLFGTTLSSTSSGPLLASGVGRLGAMLTITSNGQGAFLPLRVLCPPEIVLIELACGK
ncbi:MAG: uncharacterized protein PWP23_1015 [Candidatus Sumerlaeota bacterium]|nr:uncharacterized protein [Candidatus Sumerlaeota bacterium]